MGLQSFDERIPVVGVLHILAAGGTAYANVVAQNLGTYRIDDILLSNSDTIAHVVVIAVRSGATDYPLASISVPAGAGSGGVAPVAVAATQLPIGQSGWLFANTQDLRAKVEVVMTGATFVDVVAYGGLL
jgi:hypothetical protein